ncbi:MAG: hypothetical protein BM557_01195 [Flavobacterium sp. MedPE-SWcel]|uniref:hypothetical protein n=1 Tax=uncultured Flavobacterium sp. TaxID=165435 RepID=UPI00091838BA|nr:hypothetical protein [uncultured Flavobacterium sp.]OIQ22023.1 MAG: hypothetical protein BM557_01195 [Flavobacterium sp. MedPE-SWcel]
MKLISLIIFKVAIYNYRSKIARKTYHKYRKELKLYLPKSYFPFSRLNRLTDENLHKLHEATSIDKEKLIQLQNILRVTYQDMCSFYLAIGFLPTKDIAIGIKHFGIDLVLEAHKNIQTSANISYQND